MTVALETKIIAHPGLAYEEQDIVRVQVSGSAWRIPVVFNRRKRVMIRMLGSVMNATPQDLESPVFQYRVTPFLADPRNRRSVIVTINGVTYRLSKKTRANGKFVGWIDVPMPAMQKASLSGLPLNYTVGFDDDSAQPAENRIHLLKQVGTSVVTDIDDTIKDSLVNDRRELLANTFLRNFRPVEGMVEVYNEWSDRGASFHYVSSSPWQLYEPLETMIDEFGFPLGTMHLRNFRLRDQFLKKLLLIRQKGKASAIKALMKKMPGRNFVLVGDSGERDAKIYRKICEKFPGRVKGVFIRNLEGRPFKESQQEKLKLSLPNGICSSFKFAEELAAKARPLF
ncbi:MAG: phosphatase domain-containing protein [Planctomycetota bacterium]